MSTYNRDMTAYTPDDEHLLLWNSKFKVNRADNNCYCSVGYKNHHWLSNTISFRIKSLTFTNLFPNVYGGFINLYARNVATPTVLDTLVIPADNYETTAELDTAVAAVLQAAYGGTVTVLTNAKGYMSISTTGAAFHIMDAWEIDQAVKVSCSLNNIIGMTHATSLASASTPYTMLAPVNLAGVRRIRVGSTTAGSSHSVHANGDNGDIIASVSLDGSAYGSVVSREWESSGNVACYFRDSRDCVTVDIHVVDEYDQLLSLPGNSDLDIEFIVSSRIP